MKLKIQPDSIRFRMTLSEAQVLQRDRQLSNHIAFPGETKFQFKIVIAERLQLSYQGNALIVSMSNEELQQLMNNITPKGLCGCYQSSGTTVDFSIQIDVPCHLDG